MDTPAAKASTVITVALTVTLTASTVITVTLTVSTAHSGTEVVLVREGPRAGGGSSQRKKGSDYFTSPVKTMTLRDIK